MPRSRDIRPVLVEHPRHLSDTPRSLRAHIQDYGSGDRSIGATPPHLYDHGSLDDDFSPGRPMRRHARPRLDDPVQIDHSALHAALRNLAPEPQKSSQPLVPAAAPVANPSHDDARTETDSSSSNHGWNDEMVDPWTHDSKQDLTHPRRHHISLREHQGFSLGRHHRREPIAREWGIGRKRITATIACANTVFIGLIAGIYAGEVPKIQYQIADTNHLVVWGNVCLFAAVALTTLLFWPLPLLHGRKPYTLAAFAIMLPLQFPQALAIATYSDPHSLLARWGLLLPRVLTGLAMGFANINFLPTLLDVFGASLMSDVPHQEVVVKEDIRRQGGGIGLWLGIWTWCYLASLSVGFCIGACIISALDPAWGFYFVIILLAFFLFVNVVAPETRPSPYRRSLVHFFDDKERIKRRVARGEVKLHIHNTGPKWWWEEVWAGVVLTKRMMLQPGMAVMTWYAAWIYAQVLFVLLGALLSRYYTWRASSVGLASLSLAAGALLAVPLTHAGLFSRSRSTPSRTDSMTFKHPTYVWTSHMARRCIFTLTLPLAGLAYTLASPGPRVSWVVPVVFVGLVGFLSNLAVSECTGIVMETFDTSDLQPGSNSKHRANSLPTQTGRRRTNYSSYPRVVAGLMATQSLGFVLAAAATAVSGGLTRAVGAQISTAIVAGILLGLTVMLLVVLVRWKRVQVIPDGVLAVLESRKLTLATNQASNSANNLAAGGRVGAGGQRDLAPEAEAEAEAEATGTGQDWRPVIIGNPSGKLRRMNLFELGRWTRWSEIRRLNRLDS